LVLNGGPPKNQDVDPAVMPAGRRVSWQAKRRLCCGRPPWLYPGYETGLEFGDNPSVISV
jgi:hypothetical protein